MEQKSRVGLIESVDRALQLLSLLARTERLSVTAASHALDVAPSTAHRLLSTLCARGFAVQGEDRLYRLGPEMHAAATGPRHALAELRQIVRPVLAQMSAELDESVHLVVLSGLDVRFVDGVEADQTLRVGLRVGMRIPAHATSGGKAILAALEPATVRRMYSAGLPPWPNVSIRDLPALLRELEPIRSTAIGVNRDESEIGVTAMGSCVTTPGSGLMAAISVAVPTARMSPGVEQRMTAVLKGAAASARRSLAAAAERPADAER